jgi:hypothetical protein
MIIQNVDNQLNGMSSARCIRFNYQHCGCNCIEVCRESPHTGMELGQHKKRRSVAVLVVRHGNTTEGQGFGDTLVVRTSKAECCQIILVEGIVRAYRYGTTRGLIISPYMYLVQFSTSILEFEVLLTVGTVWCCRGKHSRVGCQTAGVFGLCEGRKRDFIFGAII